MRIAIVRKSPGAATTVSVAAIGNPFTPMKIRSTVAPAEASRAPRPSTTEAIKDKDVERVTGIPFPLAGAPSTRDAWDARPQPLGEPPVVDGASCAEIAGSVNACSPDS